MTPNKSINGAVPEFQPRHALYRYRTLSSCHNQDTITQRRHQINSHSIATFFIWEFKKNQVHSPIKQQKRSNLKVFTRAMCYRFCCCIICLFSFIFKNFSVTVAVVVVVTSSIFSLSSKIIINSHLNCSQELKTSSAYIHFAFLFQARVFTIMHSVLTFAARFHCFPMSIITQPFSNGKQVLYNGINTYVD